MLKLVYLRIILPTNRLVQVIRNNQEMFINFLWKGIIEAHSPMADCTVLVMNETSSDLCFLKAFTFLREFKTSYYAKGCLARGGENELQSLLFHCTSWYAIIEETKNLEFTEI